MTDQEREDLRAELNDWFRSKGVSTDELWLALLDVGKDRIWRAGLWARLRWFANIIGVFGIIAGFAVGVAAFLGYDVVRK